MISSEFLNFISSVKNKLASDAFPHEAAVSIGIVLPILGYLGWEVHDPSCVCPQYPIEKLKADYGLKIGEDLKCIIEVKAVDKEIKTLSSTDKTLLQIFVYAFISGVPLLILTNGKQWVFYLPMAEGKHKEKLVRTLDFEKHSPDELAEGLIRYLSLGNMRSGQAKKNAENDRKKRIIERNISTTWKKLLDGTSDKLVNLLIGEMPSVSQYAPARSDVEEFLNKNIGFKPASVPTPTSRPRPEPQTKKKFGFFLLNKRYEEKNMTDAFAKIMEILAVRDEDFLMRLESQLVGKTTKWLSRNRTGLGGSGSVKKTARKLSGGWFLRTHSSTEEKIKILRKACQFAGIPFGNPRGLKIPS